DRQRRGGGRERHGHRPGPEPAKRHPGRHGDPDRHRRAELDGGTVGGTGTTVIANTGQLNVNPGTCCQYLFVGNGHTVTNNGAATLTIPSGTGGYSLELGDCS